MDRRKLSESVLNKKILLLGHKYKEHKKEEKIFMKRNKKLVNEIQSYKEMLKSINDERLALQKYIFDKKYTKAVSEGNNNALKNSLSSCLNQLHVLQTKVINSCIESQRESLEGNRHSSKKPAESYTQESTEERAVSEESCRQSREPSPLQDVSSSYDALVCKIEILNGYEEKPSLISSCDLPDSKQELSLLLSSFCRRDTVAVNEITEIIPQESAKVLPEITCETDFQESENVPLENTCESNFQESENVLLEKSTCEPDYQASEIVPLEKTCKSNFREPEVLSLEITCTSDFQKSENATLVIPLPEPQLENECMRGSPREEPFLGFETDSSEKAKSIEMLQRLSLKCKALESLRNYDTAQSLTVFESNPENTARESPVTSTLEGDLSKLNQVKPLKISLTRLDVSEYASLNSTIEIPKQGISPKRRGRKKKSKQEKEPNQRETTPDSASCLRDTTPDSASECSNNGRALRRARNPVNYKEKPLITKLRRS